MVHSVTVTLKKWYSQLVFTFFPIYRLRKSGATVGRNVFIGDGVYVELENARYLSISNDVVVSAFCKIILHDSSLNNVADEDVLYGEVHLKSRCYIGANSTILPGSVVGENTIVGAHSLVKGILKANSVYAGVPAKYISSIQEMKIKWAEKKALAHNNDLITFKQTKRAK